MAINVTQDLVFLGTTMEWVNTIGRAGDVQVVGDMFAFLLPENVTFAERLEAMKAVAEVIRADRSQHNA